jgi:hypothetical protein
LYGCKSPSLALKQMAAYLRCLEAVSNSDKMASDSTMVGE